MVKRKTRYFRIGSAFLAAFALWTAAVGFIDVQAIGPNGSSVGFAMLNGLVHKTIGVHWGLCTATDLLGLIPIGLALGFAVSGLVQLIKRRSLFKVDRSILVLGGFYIAVAAMYLLFEKVVINYRPVLIDGNSEASYPSSTTMLALCVIPTAMMQLKSRIRRTAVRRAVLVILGILTAFLLVGRLISGVHWLTDIIGGVLLSRVICRDVLIFTLKILLCDIIVPQRRYFTAADRPIIYSALFPFFESLYAFRILIKFLYPREEHFGKRIEPSFCGSDCKMRYSREKFQLSFERKSH